MNKLTKGCVAEFIGTFALCFFGCGSIVMTSGMAGGAGSLITVALAHGFVLAVFISGTMYISGGQLNPAVAVGVAVAGKQPWSQAGAFIVTQCIAGACGVGMMVFLLGQSPAMVSAMESVNHGATLGAFSIGNEALGITPSVVAVLGLEALMTFALVFVVLTTAVDDRAHKLGGVCIGLTVAIGIVAFGPMTGASMNPARSLGPAFYGHWEMQWVYWVAPIGGAALAGFVYRGVWANAEDS